jgi:SAM-dependent methyltransferase
MMNVAKIQNKLNQVERLLAEIKAELGPVVAASAPTPKPKKQEANPTETPVRLTVAESVPAARLGPRPEFGDPTWPLAVPDSLIVRDEATKDLRAAQIAKSLVEYYRSKRVLDLGCGDGRVARAVAKEAAHVVGYDPNEAKLLSNEKPEANVTWRWQLEQFDGVKKSFDFVMLYDVLDHLVGDEPFHFMGWVKELLAPGGSVFLRCHPWTSRHGNHLYEAGVNKAFLHLALTPAEMVDAGLPVLPNVRVSRPLSVYQTVFRNAGFKIRDRQVQAEPVETFFEGALLKRIIDVTWNGKATEEEAIKVMMNSFIDYDLVVQ